MEGFIFSVDLKENGLPQLINQLRNDGERKNGLPRHFVPRND